MIMSAVGCLGERISRPLESRNFESPRCDQLIAVARRTRPVLVGTAAIGSRAHKGMHTRAQSRSLSRPALIRLDARAQPLQLCTARPIS